MALSSFAPSSAIATTIASSSSANLSGSLGTGESIAGKEGIGYRALKLELLDAALQKLARCKHHKSLLGISGSLGDRKGLLSRVGLKCSSPTCGKSVLVSDPSSDEVVSLNKGAVLGARLTGNGRNTLDTITGACLGMLPPLSPASFSTYSKDIKEEALLRQQTTS